MEAYSMTNLDFTLRKEAEAVRILVEGLRTLFTGDDTSLLLDTIEGETDLLEAIDAAVAEIDETDVLVSGLREKEAQFSVRRRAMEERIRRLRALIEQAMTIAEQPKLRRPAATLSLKRIPPDVVVMAEAEIPSEYFIPQPPPPPKLDKTALRAALTACSEKLETISGMIDPEEREQALKAVRPIPGAMLSNGSFSLQIRRA
jgi:hypothetical protein